MTKFSMVVLVAVLAVACPVSFLEAAPLFRVTNLGTLGGEYSGGSSVNDFGEVVGTSSRVVGGPGYAFFHDGNTMQFLGSQADALNKNAGRINYYGDVIGKMQFGSAFIFTEGGFYTFGSPDVYLNDVNDNLVYVGSDNRAFIGNLQGSQYILPGAAPPTFTNGTARAINNSGQVVGEFWSGPAFSRSPFYYVAGGGSPTLFSPPAGYQSMDPKAINEAGAFTGVVNGAQTRAFICNATNFSVTVLPLVGNWTYSYGVDISDDGTVVGYGGTGTGITSAFLHQAGQTHLLSSLVNGTGQGWSFEHANGISPNGKYVTGLGRFGGQDRAFLLTAINPGEYIVITRASRSGTSFTLDFASDPGLANWQIKASTNLNSFPINETPDSVITETFPGVYRAVVNITGAPNVYFMRVERP